MSIISKNEENICKKAIHLFGIEDQIGMLSEECGELLSAINKFKRCRIECKEVTEEIADVIIMCVQMAHFFGYYEVQDRISFKISRLVERINNINKQQKKTIMEKERKITAPEGCEIEKVEQVDGIKEGGEE